MGNINIVNLTPHTLVFMDGDNNIIQSVPTSGIARCTQSRTQTGSVNGIPINSTSFGDVVGLPDPQLGTIFVVSALTAQAVPSRSDVFITDDAVRDNQGRVVGCRALAHV